jgi:GTP-binding protein
MARQSFPDLRNIAIIAHVDHGKTTLVDGMLRQGNIFRANQEIVERAMDSMDLERERGITIMAKNTAVRYSAPGLPQGGIKINILDTPGHADFGGEVERILNMVDGVLLLVDAAEGPLPQTRFVLRKALALSLPVILVINKIDRPDARIDEVVNETYDLFIDLGANEEQIDFPIVYTNARKKIAKMKLDEESDDLRPLFDTIVKRIPAPVGDPDAPLQMTVNNLEYDDYVGRLVIGRIIEGTVSSKQPITLMKESGNQKAIATIVYQFSGFTREAVPTAHCGDIVALSGLEFADIGDTVADAEKPKALVRIKIEEPTLKMVFRVNNSPFAGKEGKYVTSRNLGDRLRRETLKNVAIRVLPTEDPAAFMVFGRGELQLAVIIEMMRREGFELAVGTPEIVTKEVDGKRCEPVETLVVDVPGEFVGAVNEFLGPRKGKMTKMSDAGSRQRLEFRIPSRGLIGFRNRFLTLTKGTGLATAILEGYEPWMGPMLRRDCGAAIADRDGVATPYAINNIQERANLFISPGTKVYEGMIVGENARIHDLEFDVTREKKLTNMRAAGSDDLVKIVTPMNMTLERSIEWINPDELIEVTPESIRLRKAVLLANKRPKAESA